jgi:hypothetical protein
MTRKDFQLIADVIKGMNKPHNDSETVAEIAYQFALTLADTNDRFDREKFLKACGVEL